MKKKKLAKKYIVRRMIAAIIAAIIIVIALAGIVAISAKIYKNVSVDYERVSYEMYSCEIGSSIYEFEQYCPNFIDYNRFISDIIDSNSVDEYGFLINGYVYVPIYEEVTE